MERILTVTRVFNAPPELIWKTWTDPELLMQWWGPDKFTCPSAKLDFRVGGVSLVCMRAPAEFGGQDFYNIWAYTKIVPGKSIEFIMNLADKGGNKTSPTQLGMPADFPTDIRTVVSFTPVNNGQTEMTVTEYADFGQTSLFAKMGLEQSLDKAVALFAK